MEKAIILLEDYKRAERELNNFMEINSTIDDLEIVRFFMLSAHYRSPLNFSDDLMESAKNGLDRILTANGRHYCILNGGIL